MRGAAKRPGARGRGGWTAILLLPLLATGCVQDQKPTWHPNDVRRLVSENPRPPTAKFRPISPQERVTLFQESGVSRYLIGAGDTLQIVGDTEFLRGFGETSQGDIVGTRVKPDGNIYIPVLGPVPARGRTVVELQADLRERLSEYKEKPFASVDVLEFRSQKYYVIGRVATPGVYPVDGQATLLDAIGRAGGVAPDADLDQAHVVRDSKILPISLADLLVRGDQTRNVTMRDGDMVYIPSTQDRHVYVLGEVLKPGIVPMNGRDLSVVGAIAAASGIDPVHADQQQIRIFRGDWANPRCYTLSACEVYGYGHSIMLHPGDRVLVAPTGLATWSRATQLAFPFAQGLVNTALSATAIGIAASK